MHRRQRGSSIDRLCLEPPINPYGSNTVKDYAFTIDRTVIKAGPELAGTYRFPHLRFIASVGEPLNAEAVWWGARTGRRPQRAGSKAALRLHIAATSADTGPPPAIR